jgi:hypothetical protein
VIIGGAGLSRGKDAYDRIRILLITGIRSVTNGYEAASDAGEL